MVRMYMLILAMIGFPILLLSRPRRYFAIPYVT